MPTMGLLLPQWQGYSADDRPARGARQIAAALGEHARLHAIDVPGWHAPTEAAEMARGERTGGVLGLGEIVEQAAGALRWLDGAKPARLLTIGGDCGSDFAPIAWQAARSGSELGVLYLDAHGDLNTPVSSPSGRFHGMILRATLGEGAPALIALHRQALGPEQIIMAGVRDLDPAERDFLAGSSIQVLPPAAFADGRVVAAVQAHPATRWHIHFDLDVLDPDDFPDVTVPVPGGPRLDAVKQLLVEVVARRDVAGITVTEHVGGAASARRVVDALGALGALGAGWR
jgi:arginase